MSIEKGDLPGHPFRGNQYVNGGRGAGEGGSGSSKEEHTSIAKGIGSMLATRGTQSDTRSLFIETWGKGETDYYTRRMVAGWLGHTAGFSAGAKGVWRRGRTTVSLSKEGVVVTTKK